MRECLGLESGIHQLARFRDVPVGFELPDDHGAQFRLFHAIERVELFLREARGGGGIEPVVARGDIQAQPVQVIGGPVGREIRTVTPDGTDVLAAPAEIIVLTVDHVAGVEYRGAAFGFDDHRNGRFFLFDQVPAEDKYAEGEHQEEQQYGTNSRIIHIILLPQLSLKSEMIRNPAKRR